MTSGGATGGELAEHRVLEHLHGGADRVKWLMSSNTPGMSCTGKYNLEQNLRG